MSSTTVKRSGLVLFLGLLMAGCGSSSISSMAQNRVDECYGNRARCLYEGKYDVDERDYAEQEAVRLNRAQSLRIRSRSWW